MKNNLPIVIIEECWSSRGEVLVSFYKNDYEKINFYKNGSIELIGNSKAKEYGSLLAKKFLENTIFENTINTYQNSYYHYINFNNIFGIEGEKYPILKWSHRSDASTLWYQFVEGFKVTIKLKAFL